VHGDTPVLLVKGGQKISYIKNSLLPYLIKAKGRILSTTPGHHRFLLSTLPLHVIFSLSMLRTVSFLPVLKSKHFC
jgi:hypothetical protein